MPTVDKNLIERVHQKINHRIRMPKLRPNEAPCLRLVSAVLMENVEDWQTTDKHYVTFNEELAITRCNLERLMKALGLRGPVRGKSMKTTISDVDATRPADLVERAFVASRPNQLWVAVAIWRGVVYVAFCRRCNFPTYRRLASITASVGSVGDNDDNAMDETISGLYKTEVIRKCGPWCNVDEVEYATLESNQTPVNPGRFSIRDTEYFKLKIRQSSLPDKNSMFYVTA